jgi:pyrimidine-specific ribonucleoside hydrolase
LEVKDLILREFLNMSKRILLDCDPGHDDAIAMMLATSSSQIELVGVTTVAGNSLLSNTTRNALIVLDMVNRPDIPVHSGRAAPLVRELRTAAAMHGDGGLDGPVPSAPSREVNGDSALSFIENILENETEPITLVATGPLTNIADVVTQLTHLHHKIEQIVFMGGAIELGNWTPAAEFNILVDPEAAEIVMNSGLKLTMIGLEVTHQAWLDDSHADELRGKGECGEFVAELLDHFVGFHQQRFGWPGAPIHDAVTIAHLIDPSIMTTIFTNVTVETKSELTLGRTVVDVYSVTDQPANVTVGTGIDRDRFVTLLMQHLLSLS